MPVYNAEKFLSEAIGSIINQTFPDWELIIVNDGSTDNSEQIIKSQSDRRIRYYKNDENKGLTFTRNFLIELATAEYIAFLDSDDLSMPDRLKQQIEFLDHNPDYALCGSWGIMINGEGKEQKNIKLPSQNEEIICGLLFANTFIQSSITIRRHVLLSDPYRIDYPLAEDYELFARLSHKYKLRNIPLYLTEYRWHTTNITQTKDSLMENCVQQIYIRELAYLSVVPTTTELRLHYSVRETKAIENKFENYFKQLRAWLSKLAKANNEMQAFDRDSFSATILFRWIFICKREKSYFKLLRLPILPTLGSLPKLVKMIRQRL